MDGGFTTTRIRQIISEIRNDHRANRERYYREKYQEFFKKFPKLFFAAMDESFDTRMFDLMLNQRESVLASKSVQVMDEASKLVHENLNEKYVYPVFPKEELERMAKEQPSSTQNLGC